jgi:hypothetical protein
MIVSLIFDNYKKRLVESYTTVLDSKDTSTNGRRYDNIMRDVNYFKTKLEHVEGAGNTGQVIYDTVSGLYKVEEIFNADDIHEPEPEPKEKKKKDKEPEVAEPKETAKETENTQNEKKESVSKLDDASAPKSESESKDTEAKLESTNSEPSEAVVASEKNTEQSKSVDLDKSEPDVITTDAEVEPRSSVSSDEKNSAATAVIAAAAASVDADSDGDKKA